MAKPTAQLIDRSELRVSPKDWSLPRENLRSLMESTMAVVEREFDLGLRVLWNGSTYGEGDEACTAIVARGIPSGYVVAYVTAGERALVRLEVVMNSLPDAIAIAEMFAGADGASVTQPAHGFSWDRLSPDESDDFATFLCRQPRSAAHHEVTP